MPKVYERVKKHFKNPKIIHIVGTNGKGTTGRFLASALFSLGFNVGHYSSPHIMKFNERIWINGTDASDEVLEKLHQKLLTILTQEDADSLSYFEYTTLLAMYLYQEMDYVVLEAGLGGEHDATAVFDNILTLITPIDKDHESFLGNTIEEIVTTKVNTVQKIAILAKQSNNTINKLAKDIVTAKKCVFISVEKLLFEEDRDKINIIEQELLLEKYLKDNLLLAVSALNFLKIKYTTANFKNARLFGRLSKLNKNIILDVGHNVLAAKVIANSLQGNKYSLIYNSYKDKNYKEILNILKPIIKNVQIINVSESRIENKDVLEETLRQLDVKYQNFNGIEREEQYLVFGSFSVAEAFLKVYHE